MKEIIKTSDILEYARKHARTAQKMAKGRDWEGSYGMEWEARRALSFISTFAVDPENYGQEYTQIWKEAFGHDFPETGLP